MESKIRVYGKAQNRTALGIVNAYLLINPQATIDDLRMSFPVDLNPYYGGSNYLFYDKSKPIVNDRGKDKGVPYDKVAYDWNVFTAPEEILKLQDGTEVYFMKLWRADAFEAICKHAQQFGIEIADYKPKEGFKKGGYWLEYLNGFVPSVPEAEVKSSKKIPWWMWLLVAIILILVILLLLKRSPEVVEKTVVVNDTVLVVDTVYLQSIEQMETDFNAAQFELGKSELNENAKFVLHDLANLMKKNPEIKLHLEGHTSDEGSESLNMKLSEARAKAAVDFLVSKGIEIYRLSFEGKGSSEPLDKTNRELNRRTEFEVVE